MAILKCKSCGGNLDIIENSTVTVCAYCGTSQTIPTADSEKKINLFNRANRLRMNSEFDKAAGIYETIIAEFPEEAEAYWGLCLCNYGIEYVDDFATGNKVPTCHRASFEKLSSDENFNLALEFSDVVAQKQYRSEAREIDRIMDEILAISKNEKPYDVFICYKETDDKGERTIDSVLAQDIYDSLTAKGMKVFFARITLEDKLGQMYEPYIFAALNSAKVMLVVGTDYEHFHAVWVKNEWSRFLKLMAKDKSKVIIPCYKDIDAYDMPDEFRALQAQDMGKIGFMQDLLRGVEKITNNNGNRNNFSEASGDRASSASLLKRAFIFMEDGDWTNANKYCEKVLDIDPENALAYVGELMIELKISKREKLKDAGILFDNNKNYIKAMRYADENLKKELLNYIHVIGYTKAENIIETDKTEEGYRRAAEFFAHVSGYLDADKRCEECKKLAEEAHKASQYDKAYELYQIWTADSVEKAKNMFDALGDYSDSADYSRRCEERKTEIENNDLYARACRFMSATDNVEARSRMAADLFRSISGWKDSEKLAEVCIKQAEDAHKDEIYKKAFKKFNDAKKVVWEGVTAKRNVQEAQKLFEEISGWKNADNKAEECRKYIAEKEALELEKKRAEEARNAQYRRQMKMKKTWSIIKKVILFGGAAAIVIGIVLYAFVINPENKFETALAHMEAEEYIECYEILCELDSKSLDEDLPEIKYALAEELVKSKEYYKACVMYDQSGEYEDATEKYLAVWKKVIKSWKKKVSFDSVALGLNHSVAVKKDGTAVAIGDNDSGQCNVSDWTDIISVSAGYDHSVGLRSDGTVVAVGTKNACNVSDWKYIVAVFADSNMTIGLRGDGTVVSTTIARRGWVSGWEDIVSIAIGPNATIGLKSDGTVVSAGKYKKGVRDVSDWTDIKKIDTNIWGTVGLKKDGTIVATKEIRLTDKMYEINDIVSFCLDGYDILVLRKNGRVLSSSYNNDDVSGWSNIAKVYQAGANPIALTKNGTVKTIGVDNWQSATKSWRNIKKLYIATDFIIGQKKDGSFVSCSVDEYFDRGIPAEADVKAWKGIIK